MNRVFSDTTIARVEASWTTPEGGGWTYWFEPPTKPAVQEHDVAHIAGYIGDAKLLGDLRREFLADKSFTWRVRRAVRNVRLLAEWNYPWPEEEWARRTPWRHSVQELFNDAVRVGVLPLAALGMLVARKRAPLAVFASHLATVVVLSMLFFPEARYRCPYDPMLLVLAAGGVGAIVALLRRLLRGPGAWLRARVRARRSTPVLVGGGA